MNNLVTPRFPNGLTHPYQTVDSDPENYTDLAYLEDNCEVYRGLADFVYCLKLAKDTAGAATYTPALNQTLSGIKKLYNASGKYWWHDWELNDTHDPVKAVFYPDLVSQVFPQAYGVPVPTAWYDVGYHSLDATFPEWPVNVCGPNGDPCDDQFPWALLGYVAALRHQTAKAEQQVNHIQGIAADPSQRGALTMNELGWYQRTLVALGVSG